jgi:hypothetical protein
VEIQGLGGIVYPKPKRRGFDELQYLSHYFSAVEIDLTGDFCTSRKERLEVRKEPENAEENVYARADRGQVAAD